ncbi:MAG TPA: hypothetical protein VE078_04935 [Thermoanaerobaculia bacterium]|nr:hypothetical protein [Thermoanaerobaculia bacterium]
MTANRSSAEALASLEAQTAFHREREAFHAKHEKSPREQRELHAAELEAATRRLDAFKAAAAEALDHFDRAPASQPQQDLKKQDLGTALRPRMGRMVAALIAEKGATERFGPVALTAEVNQRYDERLRKPLTVSQVSVVLRRFERMGRIFLVRPGKPHWEAMYVRERPPRPQSRTEGSA